MEKQEYIERIERFIDGNMAEVEKKEMEQELTTNAILKKEVEFHRSLKAAINKRHEINALKAKLNKAKQESANTKVVRLRPLAIAASILLLAVAGFWLFKTTNTYPSTETLYATHFELPKDQLTEMAEDNLTGFATTDIERWTQLKAAGTAYENENYQQTLQILTAYSNNYTNDKLAQYYLALTYLQLNQTEASISILKTLSEEAHFDLKVDSQWYLALAYLRMNEVKSAKILLQQLSNTTYAQDATELLNQLP